MWFELHHLGFCSPLIEVEYWICNLTFDCIGSASILQTTPANHPLKLNSGEKTERRTDI